MTDRTNDAALEAGARPQPSRREAAAMLLLAATLVGVYAPAVSDCLFSDDYSFYNEFDGYCGLVMGCGRPVHVLQAHFLDTLRDLPGGKRVGHAITLAMVAGVSLMTFRLLRRTGATLATAWLVSLLVMLLPSIQIAVAPLYASMIVLGSLPAAASALVLFPVIEGSLPARESRLRVGIAAALLLLAGATYQPGMLYFWPLAAAVALSGPFDPERAKRTLRWIAFGAGTIALYLGLYFVCSAAFGVERNRRAVLVTSISAKLEWFLGEVIPNALGLWVMPFREPAWYRWIGLVGAVIAVGLAIRIGREVWLGFRAGRWAGVTRVASSATILLGLGAMLPLCYVFSLAVEESWAAYRSTLPVCAFALFLFAAGIGAVAAIFGRRGSLAGEVALAACAVAAVPLARSHLIDWFLVPQRQEFAYLSDRLAEADLDAVERIHVIRCHWNDGAVKPIYYDEFGMPSSCKPWGPIGMVHRALMADGRAVTDYEITQAEAGQPVPDEAFVIDMRWFAKTPTVASDPGAQGLR